MKVTIASAAVVVLVVLGIAIGLALLHFGDRRRPGPLWEQDAGARPLMPPGGLP